MKDVTITVYHDSRKPSQSGIYPVILKVYHNKLARFFPVFHNHQKLRLSIGDFASSYHAIKTRSEFRPFKISIEACYKRAAEIVAKMQVFEFRKFEFEYLGATGAEKDLIHLYNTIIQENDTEGRIKNAHAYRCSLNSLVDYVTYVNSRKPSEISFSLITPAFLKDYQRYMTQVEHKVDGLVKKRKLSTNTVGIYTRSLRAVFNRAVEERLVHGDQYPFGKSKGKYQIPSGRKVKKGLTKEQLRQFYEMDLSDNPTASKARDFWILSFVCNGMQFKDIANLKYSDIDGEFFSFIRHKTKNTTISNHTPIIVPITHHVRYMIEKYGNKTWEESAYVFPVLNASMDAKEQTKAVGNFTRFVSQNLKRITKELGISVNLANMVARHTFATAIMRSGKSIEYVQQALGHQNKQTTEAYFAGFENHELLATNKKLLDFS